MSDTRPEGPVLEAVELSKRYDGVTALEKLNLQVGAGEIFCLLGANGAGKTTTINLFLDFIPADGGVARVSGLDVADHPIETKRHLAFIPEQVTLYGNLSGLENLAYFSALAGHGEYSTAELRDCLVRAGLEPEAAERRVSTYSKGMRQKVAVAIAIAKRARALLLDEPTSGLDPQASNEFSRLLTQLAGEGVAILMATHDLFRAKETGTRVGIMNRGRLVTLMDPAHIDHAGLERIYLEHMRA